MRLNEVTYGEGTPIDGYGPGFFRVGGDRREGAVAILPAAGVTEWGGYEDVGTILAAADAIDVLLVGTGAEMAPVPEAFRARLEAVGIGVEVMGTGSACRTYNVLLGEGRRIGAALLPV